NIIFSNGSSQFFNDLNIPCRASTEAQAGGYYGAFGYISAVDFDYFPAPLWPFTMLAAIRIRAPNLVTRGATDGYVLQFVFKNISDSDVNVQKMNLNGSNAGMWDSDRPANTCNSCPLGACGADCQGCWHGLLKTVSAPTVTDFNTMSTRDINYARRCYNFPPYIVIPAKSSAGILMDREIVSCATANTVSNVSTVIYYKNPGGSLTNTSTFTTGIKCVNSTSYSGTFTYLSPDPQSDCVE
ncbi:MAG: hypothetical protein WC308_02770, partial [archaeon]